MVSISKINPILNVQNTNKARNIARKTLPAASALGILAGSSMGPSAADAIGQGISNAADGIAGLVDHILDSLG